MFIEFISINPKIPRIINKVEKKVSGWVREKGCEIKMGFWDGTLRKVSPLDETALARQFRFSALRRLRTTQLSPTMTGPTKTEDRRGMKSHGKVQGPHRRDREFPEPLTGASPNMADR